MLTVSFEPLIVSYFPLLGFIQSRCNLCCSTCNCSATYANNCPVKTISSLLMRNFFTLLSPTILEVITTTLSIFMYCKRKPNNSIGSKIMAYLPNIQNFSSEHWSPCATILSNFFLEKSSPAIPSGPWRPHTYIGINSQVLNSGNWFYILSGS